VSEGRKRAKRTPQQKKRLELKRDTVDGVAKPKLFRRNWPKKKARVERAHRHASKQALTNAGTDEDGASSSIPQKRVEKWKGTAVPLAKLIEWNRTRRKARHGRAIRRRELVDRVLESGSAGYAMLMERDDVNGDRVTVVPIGGDD